MLKLNFSSDNSIVRIEKKHSNLLLEVITTFELTHADDLETIYSEIIPKYPDLEIIDLKENNISMDNNFDFLSKVPNLKELTLRNFSDVDNLKSNNLRILNLNDNPPIQSIDVSSLPNLEELYISTVRSELFPSKNLRKLKILHVGFCDRCTLYSYLSFMPLLETLKYNHGGMGIKNILKDYRLLLICNLKIVNDKMVSPFILQKRETIRKRIWLIHNLFYFKRK